MTILAGGDMLSAKMSIGSSPRPRLDPKSPLWVCLSGIITRQLTRASHNSALFCTHGVPDEDVNPRLGYLEQVCPETIVYPALGLPSGFFCLLYSINLGSCPG